MLKNVDYHIIDRCNLNCAGCNDFSPLVSPDDKGKSIEQITADFMLLSKIKNEFYILNIMGGEPTLHPELSKILRIARQIFPDNKIRLLTNGTNYDKFYRWKDAIVENKIDVAGDDLQLVAGRLPSKDNEIVISDDRITDGYVLR